MSIILVNNDESNNETSLPTSLDDHINRIYESSAIIKTLIPDFNMFLNSIKTIINNYVLLNEAENEISFEILIENERGMKMFGIQIFSSNFLIPKVDPTTKFCNINGYSINNDLKLFSIDELNEETDTGLWKWCWQQWFVLCFNGDINVTGQRAIYCDYEGWFYSKNFTMTNWYGEFSLFRFLFCRRRLLIRLKEKIKR